MWLYIQESTMEKENMAIVFPAFMNTKGVNNYFTLWWDQNYQTVCDIVEYISNDSNIKPKL